MQLFSLHPFDTEVAEHYVRVVQGTEPPPAAWTWWQDAIADYVRAGDGSDSAAMRLTAGLAQAMASAAPGYVSPVASLTTWESQFDRGMGNYMRPPSRALIDAGMDRRLVQDLPIRLELQGGVMGGSYIPARLMGQVDELIDQRLERWAKRIHDAEMDPFEPLATLRGAVDEAMSREAGLIEAVDIGWPEMTIARTPTKKELPTEFRARIEKAIEPEKKPGLFGRLFGRGREGDG